MAIINQDDLTLRSAIKIMKDQKRSRLDNIKKALESADIPTPPKIIQAISELNPSDARKILCDHPGFPLWEKRKSYKSSRRIFEHSVTSLFAAIQVFEEASGDPTIFRRARAGDLSNLECAVESALFATANSAHSLVDHSRRLNKAVNLANYDEQRKTHFSDDGLHEFVIALRTLIHHIQALPPNWQITSRFESGARTATFTLDRDEVLRVVERERDGFTNKESFLSTVRYLRQASDQIDLRKAFQAYHQRTRDFHGWFSEAIELHPSADLCDYERCLSENKKHSTRVFWKAMLGNWVRWDQPPNPYNHLDRFLTAEQLAEVGNLPMGSAAQVDKVIEFMDPDGACDDELRNLVHQLFDCAKP